MTILVRMTCPRGCTYFAHRGENVDAAIKKAIKGETCVQCQEEWAIGDKILFDQGGWCDIHVEEKDDQK